MVLWNYCVLLCFFMFTEKINEMPNGKDNEFDSIIVLVNQCNFIMRVHCLCVYVCV